MAEFFDTATAMGVDQITMSPGYFYEDAPRQDIFLSRQETKNLFRGILAKWKTSPKKWPFSHSSLFLDFLAGNQSYQCTPWSNPCYNVFGWQKPCYLLNRGVTSRFETLLKETKWEEYGVGRNEKCNNCMASCGYEGTAVNDMFLHPLKALAVSLRGPKLKGKMAPELPNHLHETT